MPSKKTSLLLALAAAAFAFGIAESYFYPTAATPPTALLSTAVFCFLIFAWYHVDSSQRGYKRSIWLNLGVVGVAIVALPYYFFRSRGARQGALAVVLSLAMVFGIAVLYSLGAAIGFGLAG